ncbi:MAG: hypothetical protein HDR77_11035 [Bacteroides sp.]|nr:hypothetical protein [Bacteroides sp.]
MKTFIINQYTRIKSFDKKLDFNSLLRNNEWHVFSDNEVENERWLFIDRDRVLVSICGCSTYFNWKFYGTHSSFIIESPTTHPLLFKVIAYDQNLVMLNLADTNEFVFLISNSYSLSSSLEYGKIQLYLFVNHGIDFLSDEQRKEYNDILKKKRIEEQKLLEEEMRRKEINNSAYERITKYLVIWLFIAILFIFLITKFL